MKHIMLIALLRKEDNSRPLHHAPIWRPTISSDGERRRDLIGVERRAIHAEEASP
jgi:hypothetical protein